MKNNRVVVILTICMTIMFFSGIFIEKIFTPQQTPCKTEFKTIQQNSYGEYKWEYVDDYPHAIFPPPGYEWVYNDFNSSDIADGDWFYFNYNNNDYRIHFFTESAFILEEKI